MLDDTNYVPRLRQQYRDAIRAAVPYVEAPRFVESERLAPFNPRGSDVAVVLDLMIHDIDLVRLLVGGPVAEVRAVGVPVLTPSVDIANARLVFASGAVANITASRVSRERMRKLRLFQAIGTPGQDPAELEARVRAGVERSYRPDGTARQLLAVLASLTCVGRRARK